MATAAVAASPLSLSHIKAASVANKLQGVVAAPAALMGAAPAASAGAQAGGSDPSLPDRIYRVTVRSFPRHGRF